LPIILKKGMGYSTTQSQLLSAPPYILAAIMAFASGWLGDRLRVRGPIIAVHQGITAVGMILTAFGPNNAVRYFGAFLGMLFPLTMTYCLIGLIGL
jgi:MFS family permease